MSRGVAATPASLWFATVAALLLAVTPLPLWIAPARTDWLTLLVVYWVLRAPRQVGMGFAWLLGLAMDAICGGMLGPRALAMSVVAYAALVLRARMLHHTLPQQMAEVFLLSACAQLLLRWAQGFSGHTGVESGFLMGSLTAAFCWPVVSMQVGSRRRLEAWDGAA